MQFETIQLLQLNADGAVFLIHLGWPTQIIATSKLLHLWVLESSNNLDLQVFTKRVENKKKKPASDGWTCSFSKLKKNCSQFCALFWCRKLQCRETFLRENPRRNMVTKIKNKWSRILFSANKNVSRQLRETSVESVWCCPYALTHPIPSCV
jgi:hypothetical protein